MSRNRSKTNFLSFCACSFDLSSATQPQALVVSIVTYIVKNPTELVYVGVRAFTSYYVTK